MCKIKTYYGKNYLEYKPELIKTIITKDNLSKDELRRLNRYYFHPQGERKCSNCGEVKPATSEHYYIKRYYKDDNGNVSNIGLSGYCKDCDKIRQRKDKLKVRQDPKTYCDRLVSSLKHRAKEANVPFDLTGEDLYNQLVNQKFKCYYSKEKLDFTLESEDSRYPHRDMPSVDRLNPCDGYTTNNVVWSKYFINRMKNDLTFGEFKDLCKIIVKNFGQG